MKTVNGLIMIISFFVSCLLMCMVPYPYTSKSIVSKNEWQFINDKYEQELLKIDEEKDISLLNLDWFYSMDEIFKKNVTTKVIDCESLKSYYVIRTGGSNHADVETVSKKDTEIFKSLYGEWSWLRRPVWVVINGIYYAGSINGYPHGYSTINTNNENGHTCIHFFKSKTHGTKRVDETHQQAVSDAYAQKEKLLGYITKK